MKSIKSEQEWKMTVRKMTRMLEEHSLAAHGGMLIDPFDPYYFYKQISTCIFLMLNKGLYFPLSYQKYAVFNCMQVLLTYSKIVAKS